MQNASELNRSAEEKVLRVVKEFAPKDYPDAGPFIAEIRPGGLFRLCYPRSALYYGSHGQRQAWRAEEGQKVGLQNHQGRLRRCGAAIRHDLWC